MLRSRGYGCWRNILGPSSKERYFAIYSFLIKLTFYHTSDSFAFSVLSSVCNLSTPSPTSLSTGYEPGVSFSTIHPPLDPKILSPSSFSANLTVSTKIEILRIFRQRFNGTFKSTRSSQASIHLTRHSNLNILAHLQRISLLRRRRRFFLPTLKAGKRCKN
jgi:hypothetical protein